jgi:imidazoleglycerol phosphate dehydratase HisB
MKCWWKRNHNIDRGDYTQDEVEDFTGRIPLFLTKCIVKDEKGKEKINLASEFFADVYDEALMFESVFQERNKDDHHALSVYVQLVLSIQLSLMTLATIGI